MVTRYTDESRHEERGPDDWPGRDRQDERDGESAARKRDRMRLDHHCGPEAGDCADWHRGPRYEERLRGVRVARRSRRPQAEVEVEVRGRARAPVLGLRVAVVGGYGAGMGSGRASPAAASRTAITPSATSIRGRCDDAGSFMTKLAAPAEPNTRRKLARRSPLPALAEGRPAGTAGGGPQTTDPAVGLPHATGSSPSRCARFYRPGTASGNMVVSAARAPAQGARPGRWPRPEARCGRQARRQSIFAGRQRQRPRPAPRLGRHAERRPSDVAQLSGTEIWSLLDGGIVASQTGDVRLAS